MKKYSVWVPFLAVCLLCNVLTGCGKNGTIPSTASQSFADSTVQTNNPSFTNAAGELSYREVWLTCLYYRNVEEILRASTNVYSGEVVAITFDVFNERTGEIDRSAKTDDGSRMLYTFYTVRIIDNFKGTTSPETTAVIPMPGGISSRTEEQKAVCMEAGVSYPIIRSGTKELSVGESYLFCVRRVPSYDVPVNIEQFSYSPDSAEAEAIRQACLELN